MNRRQFSKLLTGTIVGSLGTTASSSSMTSLLSTSSNHSKAPISKTLIRKTIPSSGELIPAIGMGSSRTFDVGLNSTEMITRQGILEHFFAQGGTFIDSSPMYGNSEAVLGKCLSAINSNKPPKLFSATKVWTRGKAQGIRQMNQSLNLWGLDTFDLMQIHNLVDWKAHLATLRDWKSQGKIRYIGITTSHGRSHAELEQILKTEPLDFVQLTYNIKQRRVEDRLLKIAQEKQIAVIVNRPFNALFQYSKGKPLPEWASEFDCTSWAQFYLKYVISHPAVTCAIPATSKLKHMQDNMQAGFGRLPDAAMRKEMERYFRGLS